MSPRFEVIFHWWKLAKSRLKLQNGGGRAWTCECATKSWTQMRKNKQTTKAVHWVRWIPKYSNLPFHLHSIFRSFFLWKNWPWNTSPALLGDIFLFPCWRVNSSQCPTSTQTEGKPCNQRKSTKHSKTSTTNWLREIALTLKVVNLSPVLGTFPYSTLETAASKTVFWTFSGLTGKFARQISCETYFIPAIKWAYFILKLAAHGCSIKIPISSSSLKGRHNKGARMKLEWFSCHARHIILLWAESGDDDSDEDVVGKLFIPAVQISLSLSSQEEATSAPSRASADTAVH